MIKSSPAFSFTARLTASYTGRLTAPGPQAPRPYPRYLSTDPTTPAPGPADLRHQALTLLHKTASLLPRALPRKDHAAHLSESLEFWHESIALTSHHLTHPHSDGQNARIVIYGVDKWAGAQDTVAALLHEPFASDDAQNTLLRNRWHGHDSRALTISHAASPGPEATLRLPSPYLAHFALPLQITELSPPPDSPIPSNAPLAPIWHDLIAATALCTADIPVIICNPLTTPLPALLDAIAPLNNPNTILILTSTTPIPAASLAQHHPCPPKILFADPQRALHALETLASARTSLAIQRFQDDFTSSRISALTDAITHILSSTPSSSPPPTPTSLHTHMALAHIRGALAACRRSLQRAERGIAAVCADTSALDSRIDEAKARVHAEVLGEFGDRDEVGKALGAAETDVRAVLDWLTWWRVLWRVDEVGAIVGDAVEKAWCKDLEKNLILHTGRLIALQETLTSSALALFSRPASPFSSPLLLNSLHQLLASPSYPLTPSALTAPLHARRAQLAFPAARLHRAGQRVALGMGGGAAAGVGLAWGAWAGAGGTLGIAGVDAGTAVGAGVLAALLGVRWAVGAWEGAKRRWMEDWRRVGDGLERDLEGTLDRTVRENVVVVAERAAAGLEGWAVKRREEVEGVREELFTLEDDLGALQELFQR